MARRAQQENGEQVRRGEPTLGLKPIPIRNMQKHIQKKSAEIAFPRLWGGKERRVTGPTAEGTCSIKSRKRYRLNYGSSAFGSAIWEK